MNSIEPLQHLPKGVMGWKVRRLEILIIETMQKATQPNTCWNIYQKIKRKDPAHGEEIGLRMQSLARRDRLEIIGHDDDGDCLYTVKDDSCTADCHNCENCPSMMKPQAD